MEPIFVTPLTKVVGGYHPPQIFEMNPRMMLILVLVVSLGYIVNIDTKISANMPSVWLLGRNNDMRPHTNQEIWFAVQKYRKKLDFG